MDKNNNLPVEVKRNLPIEQQRNNKRIIDAMKRIGKVGLNLGVAATGLAVMGIGVPVAGVLGTGIWAYGAVNAVQNVIYKKQKDSMFVTRRNIKGELTLSQDSTNMQAFSKLKGLSPQEKAAVMGLEMFVGFQNFQQQFQDQDKKKEPCVNSEHNAYRQVFSTVTHGVNIKTMQALEKLGYIQIEKNEPTKKSTLLFERLGFKQYQEVQDILKATLTFDREKIREHEKQMNEIKFRITDKPLDLDEVYKQFLEVKDTRGNNPMRKPLIRVGILLDILKQKNIDIETDALGMKKINHNAQKPFAERVKAELQNQNNGKAFRESLQVQLSPEQQKDEQVASVENIKDEKDNNRNDEER